MKNQADETGIAGNRAEAQACCLARAGPFAPDTRKRYPGGAGRHRNRPCVRCVAQPFDSTRGILFQARATSAALHRSQGTAEQNLCSCQGARAAAGLQRHSSGVSYDVSQWEYLVLRVDLVLGERPLIRWIGSTEVENGKQSAPIWDRLNEYGDQGWERIGFEPFGTRHTSVVLKRPKG